MEIDYLKKLIKEKDEIRECIELEAIENGKEMKEEIERFKKTIRKAASVSAKTTEMATALIRKIDGYILKKHSE
ncbi:unnamed protein product [Caenorhabditis sp. 36 PRJEB53466]|nr:unnamed protein product [Caenorhabditis sp. 36 PRJEB53466]